MSVKHSRAMLRDMLGADIDAQKSVSVSRQFADDFETVAAHYNLHQLGEYELAKDAARRDIEAAQEAFAAIAAEIRKGQA